MAVNARTFQVLSIIRERALADLTTTQEDISESIANHRKISPGNYNRAYISPSALVSILDRMVGPDDLLSHGEENDYWLTPMGSQMADLLVNIDGCSNLFIDNYKKMVCYAALQQHSRLGLGPATPSDIANATGLSGDSVRRGLSDLVQDNQVEEDRSGRPNLYTLPSGADDGSTPEKAQVSEEDIEDAARKGYNLGKKVDDDPTTNIIAETLAEIAAGEDECWVPTKDAPLLAHDPLDHLPRTLSQLLESNPPTNAYESFWDPKPFATVEQPAEETEFEKHLDIAEETEFDTFPTRIGEAWFEVPFETRESLYAQATASGMTLPDFLDTLVHSHETKIREVLFGDSFYS